jgi:acyl-Coa thioesterase superfamily protein/acyl-CoA thioesterase superfamily protein
MALRVCLSVRPSNIRLVHTVFFEPAGPGAYLATAATAGPWSPEAQHGGPPSALAAHEMERYQPDEGMRLGRVAVDILRPVPVGPVTARTRMLRPGRRVALLETVMESSGQEVLIARGWRIAKSETPVIESDASPPAIPETNWVPYFGGSGHLDGYLSAVEWRFVSGGFDTAGPAMAWGRPRVPLVAGEVLSPMCLALLLADSGSGISMTLDPAKFLFINVDLTVALHRDPQGDWLLLDSATLMGGEGTGVAETRLWDSLGVVGTGLQTLIVAPL